MRRASCKCDNQNIENTMSSFVRRALEKPRNNIENQTSNPDPTDLTSTQKAVSTTTVESLNIDPDDDRNVESTTETQKQREYISTTSNPVDYAPHGNEHSNMGIKS